MRRRPWPFVLCLLLLSGCRGRAAMPESGQWTGAVDLPSGIAVPLQMNLDLAGPRASGYFLVGDERTAIPEISRNGDELTLAFSEYSAEIRARWDGARLAGEYRRIRSTGTTVFAFSAAPDPAGRTTLPAGETRVAGPMGNYHVQFEDRAADQNTTVATFWASAGATRGTFIAPDGDYGLLVGHPSDKGLQLSRFTGWQALAITLEPDGETWKGRYYAGSSASPRGFVLGARDDRAPQVPTAPRTAMKDPNAEFVFSGRLPSGELVSHTDDRFKGRALIIDIMGTWCHNCQDESPVLGRIQERFGKDGLDVVGLSFEISDDPVLAQKNLQLYKERFGLTYPLLFCGDLYDDNVMRQLHSQLDNFFAYPTTIFIDKSHKVRAIHSGFKGPGTGEEFQAQIREFEELAASLVK